MGAIDTLSVYVCGVSDNNAHLKPTLCTIIHFHNVETPYHLSK